MESTIILCQRRSMSKPASRLRCGIFGTFAIAIALFLWKQGLPASNFGRVGDDPDLLIELTEIVQNQADAWNEGDLKKFMQAYWKDERLSFSSGGTVTRGWEATFRRYEMRYPDRKTMGKLTFSELEAMPLGDRAALMLGRWKLDREAPAEGNFSLVWRKDPNGWVIVHDHTSLAEKPSPKRSVE